MHSDAALEWRHKIEPPQHLWMGDVADIQRYHRRSVTQIRFVSVDNRRTMKTADGPRGRLAFFLARQPPASRLFRIFRIADVQKNQNLSAVSRHIRGKVCITPAGITHPVHTRAPRLPM